MDEMINKFKQGATKALDEAEKFTKSAVKKTKDVIDQTKYKYTISEIESKIKDVLAQIGTNIYNEYKQGAEFGEDISLKCSQLDDFYQEIDEIKAKIAQLANSKLCKACQTNIPADSAFCPKCGAKIDD